MLSLALSALLLTPVPLPVPAPTSIPAPASEPARVVDLGQATPVAVLKQRADQAFASGDYASALPIYKDLAVRLRNNPDAVAPILERIRVCEAMLPQQAPVELDFSNRTPHSQPSPDEVREVTLQDLGNFNYDAVNGGNIPDDVKALSGMTVRLRGYMIPIHESRTVTTFALVPDLFACCFGQPPQLQHTALVICPPGKGVSYYPDEIIVTGRLTVSERREDDFIVSVFEVEPSSVKPAPR
jgi:hypothetical protein